MAIISRFIKSTAIISVVQILSYFWDQTFKQCTDLGGKLAIIESNSRLMLILKMYAVAPTFKNIFIYATRARYGPSILRAAWRKGTALNRWQLYGPTDHLSLRGLCKHD